MSTLSQHEDLLSGTIRMYRHTTDEKRLKPHSSSTFGTYTHLSTISQRFEESISHLEELADSIISGA